MCKKELDAISELIQPVTFVHADFNTSLCNAKQGDFVYLDPPYVIADKKDYYRNRFDSNMHEKLKETVDKIHINNAKFMLSYDDNDDIREMYKNYNILTIKTKYSGANPDIRGEEKTELLVINYPIKEQGELF